MAAADVWPDSWPYFQFTFQMILRCKRLKVRSTPLVDKYHLHWIIYQLSEKGRKGNHLESKWSQMDLELYQNRDPWKTRKLRHTSSKSWYSWGNCWTVSSHQLWWPWISYIAHYFLAINAGTKVGPGYPWSFWYCPCYHKKTSTVSVDVIRLKFSIPKEKKTQLPSSFPLVLTICWREVYWFLATIYITRFVGNNTSW